MFRLWNACSARNDIIISDPLNNKKKVNKSPKKKKKTQNKTCLTIWLNILKLPTTPPNPLMVLRLLKFGARRRAARSRGGVLQRTRPGSVGRPIGFVPSYLQILVSSLSALPPAFACVSTLTVTFNIQQQQRLVLPCFFLSLLLIMATLFLVRRHLNWKCN